MTKIIDYYFSPMSPWTYLGHERFAALARKHGAAIDVRPVDYGKIFPASGGLPLAKRAPQRQKYRLAELKRWREYLGLPLTIEPKYFPYDTALAARTILVAKRSGGEAAAMRLTGALLRATWVEERNMADTAQLAAVLREQGLDAAALLQSAGTPQIDAEYQRLTQEAIERDVFGAPTYAYNGELFWGQDRLDLLDRALAR
ncbi:MAG TPA: 2-hydroxychromene-2-carboxylate isomerase [Burkholderiales bacterium]|nr:2-hydroxychromene-2-carboxylate isomerase [Burkholderiales bacterium]